MVNLGRFCVICCCFVISAYAAECLKELKGENELPTPTDLEFFSDIQTTRFTLWDFTVGQTSNCVQESTWISAPELASLCSKSVYG